MTTKKTNKSVDDLIKEHLSNVKKLKEKKFKNKYKNILNILKKNQEILTDENVKDLYEIIEFLVEKMTKNSEELNIENISKKLVSKKTFEKKDISEIEKISEKTTLPKEEIKEPVETSISPLEIYLCFKKAIEEKYEIYAVSSENELLAKEVINIKYENISAPIRELCCFVEYMKNLNALQNQEELKIVKVSKLYVDNLYIVNNWTNGVIKENQNEVIKELIPVATALRKEFEELGGELIYVKPKENIARIYYKENIEE